jgi:hypothetical protein
LSKGIIFRWEKESSYRRALTEIADAPTTRVVAQREFDDSQRVLWVLLSANLHAHLEKQLAALPEAIAKIAFERARQRMGDMDRKLLERFAGCDAIHCLLVDKIDIAFENTVPVVAVVAMFSDRLIFCREDEVPLGIGFAQERDRIHAELSAARQPDGPGDCDAPGQMIFRELMVQRLNPRIPTQYAELRISMQAVSETEFIHLSRDACSILDGFVQGHPLERLEFQVHDLLVNAEAVLSQLPRAGSFIEWSLYNHFAWASPFSQLEFVMALAEKISFERLHAAENLALGIYTSEVRLLSKLGPLDRFPSGLAAHLPHSKSLFGRLRKDFVKNLVAFTTGDVVMAGLLAHPLDANTSVWRKRLVALLENELKNGVTLEGSQAGMELIRAWAQRDLVVTQFARLIDTDALASDWKGTVEGYRRFQALHPRRGWTRRKR